MNNSVIIWGSMILWEVSFEYVRSNEQVYIENRKVYGYNPYKIRWASEVIEKAMKKHLSKWFTTFPSELLQEQPTEVHWWRD
jgi:hypothetical protein